MISRYEFSNKFCQACKKDDLPKAMKLACLYVGAENYVLARRQSIVGNSLDYIVSSDASFDLVRNYSHELTAINNHRTELERCLITLTPEAAIAHDEMPMPEALNKQYWRLSFVAGSQRFILVYFFKNSVHINYNKLEDSALIMSYGIERLETVVQGSNPLQDMTEREVECLMWIAEGKTSDEISTIVGISRNTINNYMMTIMRKTDTKTRSEAVAYAVRNRLI